MKKVLVLNSRCRNRWVKIAVWESNSGGHDGYQDEGKDEDGLDKREVRELGGDSSLKELLFELSIDDKGKSKQGVSQAGEKAWAGLLRHYCLNWILAPGHFYMWLGKWPLCASFFLLANGYHNWYPAFRVMGTSSKKKQTNKQKKKPKKQNNNNSKTPVNAEDRRDTGSIPGSGRSLG